MGAKDSQAGTQTQYSKDADGEHVEQVVGPGYLPVGVVTHLLTAYPLV